jgi:hypothetical protein
VRITPSLRLAAIGFASTVVSLTAAQKYFGDFVTIAASGLIALGVTTTMQRLLEENRASIWDKMQSPWIANVVLAKQFSCLFFGICLAALLFDAFEFQSPALASASLAHVYRNEFSDLVQHNLQVLIACLVLGTLYGAGGLMLVLAWNGLYWSTTIFSYLNQISAYSGLAAATAVSLALLPHLCAELLAYVLSGLGGVFAAKALRKYSLADPALARVLRAGTVMVLVAGIVLCFAALLEIYLAQTIFRYFSPPVPGGLPF